MIYSLPCSTEKFFRAFDKKITPANPFSRFVPREDTLLSGKRKGDRFYLFRQKKGLFSLFSTTLYASVSQKEKDALCLSFSRPRGAVFLLFLWSALLLWAGASIVLTEFFFSLTFLLPGIAVLLFALIPSKKEKEALLKALSGLSEEKAPLAKQPLV